MMKKITFLIFILMIFPINNVRANETETTLNNLRQAIHTLKNEVNQLNVLEKKYPIGSIYITTSNNNPSQTIGGVWESYGQGRTLISMGDNGTNNYQKISETGGISKLSLTVSNLKSHNHIVLSKGTITSTFEGISSSTSSNGDHGHSLSIQTSGAEAPGYSLGITNTGFGGRTYIYGGGYTNFANAGSHTHTLIPQGTVTSTFKGISTDTSTIGSSQPINIQNPYITVYFWKRIK